MKWYLSDLPEITIDNFANIREVRNSRLDWGEFEGEKKYLLAIAEILGERWEYAKTLMFKSKLDDFDLQGYTFLWFMRYMPEVYLLNPWIAKDLVDTVKERSSDKIFMASSWLNLLNFNIALDIDNGIKTAVINASHHSSMIRSLVQKTLFWCYDKNSWYYERLVDEICDSIERSHFISHEYELLILLYDIKKLRSRIEEIILIRRSESSYIPNEKIPDFFNGKSNKLKIQNPIMSILNEVMGQVHSVTLDAVVKFSTYDVYQRVLFDQSFLLDGFRIRVEQDNMNKNYYQLERTETGDIILSGLNY